VRFIWPLDDHYITRRFDFVSPIYVEGDNGVKMHAAVDLVRLYGDTGGRPIKAVAAGVVVGDSWDPISGFHIVLDHEGGWRTTYRHLNADAPPVLGQQVAQGEIIGFVGTTGLSAGPHLHFDLWHSQPQDPTAHAKVGWWAHDPELYLGQEEEMQKPLRFIKAETGPEWVTNGVWKLGITDTPIKTDLINIGLAEGVDEENKPFPVQQVFIDWLSDYPGDHAELLRAIAAVPGGSGSGLTFDETVKAGQEAARRGTR